MCNVRNNKVTTKDFARRVCYFGDIIAQSNAGYDNLKEAGGNVKGGRRVIAGD